MRASFKIRITRIVKATLNNVEKYIVLTNTYLLIIRSYLVYYYTTLHSFTLIDRKRLAISRYNDILISAPEKMTQLWR